MRAFASMLAAAGAVVALRSWQRRRRDRAEEWVWQAATAPRDLR